RVGLFLAQGETVQTSEIKVGSCAEGVKTTYAVCELSQNLGINMPIASQVKATLDGRSTPHESIMALMNRPLSTE
ncbi:MAG: hypothetical protein K8F91_08845, partial [Candidatus Obscuribacterales bacterium]|nr:hypothetical protein [Candidatus Obscuribacterales bacterium]